MSYVGDRAEIDGLARRLPERAALFDRERLGFTTVVLHHSDASSRAERLLRLFEREADAPGGVLERLHAAGSLRADTIAP